MAIMGPFVESGVNPHILSEFDFKIEKASKIRSVIRVETQLGTYAIKKANISYTQAERMVKAMNFLDNKGFAISKLVENKFGESFIPTENGIIYVTKWIEGKDMTLNHFKHLSLSVSLMAQMHQIGFSYEPNIEYPLIDELYLRKSWDNKVDWLKRYNKKLKRNTSNKTFEHIFQSYIPFLLDWSNDATENLNQWLIQYNSIGDLRKTISHGKFHHRNILFTPEEQTYLLDFEHVSMDTPIRDLAYFIRHYILNKEHRAWASEWLDLYQKQIKLTEPEKKLLGIYLLFPERLISLARSYDKGDKSWNDDAYLKKLQIRWAQAKEMVWFVDQNQWLNN